MATQKHYGMRRLAVATLMGHTACSHAAYYHLRYRYHWYIAELACRAADLDSHLRGIASALTGCLLPSLRGHNKFLKRSSLSAPGSPFSRLELKREKLGNIDDSYPRCHSANSDLWPLWLKSHSCQSATSEAGMIHT